MARIFGASIDYIPLDVDYCTRKTNMEILRSRYGCVGSDLFVTILAEAGNTKGYYAEINNDCIEKWAAQMSNKWFEVEIKHIEEILEYFLKKNIFNMYLYQKYKILTSQGMQERYFQIINRRKNVNIFKEYLLVSFPISDSKFDIEFSQNVNILDQNVNILDQNVYRSTQSKVKESKEKVKESKENKTAESYGATILKPDEMFESSKQEESSKEKISDEAKMFAQWFNTLLPAKRIRYDNEKIRWARTYDQMVREDKRDPDEIRKVCLWARNNSFWSPNFLSASKLRERQKSGGQYYDIFLANIQIEEKNGKSGTNNSKNFGTLSKLIPGGDYSQDEPGVTTNFVPKKDYFGEFGSATDGQS